MSRLSFAIALVVVAFGLRIGLVYILRDVHAAPDTGATADDVQFHAIAKSVADGNGYSLDGKPTSFRAPGFPLLLAGVFRLTENCNLAGYLFLCALGAVTCLIAYLLAGRLGFDEPGARIVGILTALYFPHMYWSTLFLSEVPFTFCLVLGVWLLVLWHRSERVSLLLLAGFVLGYASLIRAYSLLLIPLFGLIFLFSSIPWKDRLVRCFAFGLPFLVVIGPWTYRNYDVHGKFVLLASNGGSTFYGGNNERVVTEPRQFGHWISTTELPHRDLIEAQPNEISHDKMEWKLGLDWVRAHPEKWPHLVVFKLGRLALWPPEFEFTGWISRVLRVGVYWPILLLSLVGVWACIRTKALRGRDWNFVHLTIVATLITAVIFWGSPRFRDANAPLIMLYATVGIAWLFPRKIGMPMPAEESS